MAAISVARRVAGLGVAVLALACGDGRGGPDARDSATLGSTGRSDLRFVRAVDAGIPVISINSGADASPGLGILAHVGQSEYEAGRAGGERLAASGARRVLCVNHEVGNVAQDQRCRGLADALGAAGGVARVLSVELADPEDTQQRIAGALAADPDIDGVMTLGPAAAAPALAALATPGQRDAVAYATFDLTPEVLE
ncbi:MAG: substrate-binding domain-containing protein, partial [Gemmatimonadota bacterium]